MKYWGRGALMYLTITVLLYGTHEIWARRSYDVAVGPPTPTLPESRELVTTGTPGNR